MVQLNSGNVLLKPTQKRRILSHLRRCHQLGEAVGDVRMIVSLKRSGKGIEASAKVTDRAGRFECRERDQDWKYAVERLIRTLHTRMHAQRLAVRAS